MESKEEINDILSDYLIENKYEWTELVKDYNRDTVKSRFKINIKNNR